jgi:hypothetical protein
VTFQTTAGVAFYRITDPAILTNPAGLLNFTILDQALVAEQQYHLLESQPIIAAALAVEPVDPTTWRGTDMFNLADLTQALQRRRNQFLYETAITLNHEVVAGILGAEGRLEIPETITDVRRVAWIDPAGLHTHLWRVDEWASTAQQPLWNVSPQAPPYAYSLSVTPPLKIQIIPPPSIGSLIDLLTVRVGAPLDPTIGVLVGVPDDWAWAVKWGALADLLGHDGLARDPDRAEYCEQRWQLGVEAAKIGPDVLIGQINGITAPVVAIHDLDSMNPGWQDTTGTPTIIAVERDMVALSPVPTGISSITLDVLRPTPVPPTDATQLDIGQEILDAILDYAHHIALFKEGGAEFAVTIRQYKNFVKLAADYNDKLRALAVYREVIEDRSTREEQRRPRREQAEVSQ